MYKTHLRVADGRLQKTEQLNVPFDKPLDCSAHHCIGRTTPNCSYIIQCLGHTRCADMLAYVNARVDENGCADVTEKKVISPRFPRLCPFPSTPLPNHLAFSPPFPPFLAPLPLLPGARPLSLQPYPKDNLIPCARHVTIAHCVDGYSFSPLLSYPM